MMLDLNSNICNKCSIGCVFSKTKRITISNVKVLITDVFYVVLAEIKLLVFSIILC